MKERSRSLRTLTTVLLQKSAPVALGCEIHVQALTYKPGRNKDVRGPVGAGLLCSPVSPVVIRPQGTHAVLHKSVANLLDCVLMCLQARQELQIRWMTWSGAESLEGSCRSACYYVITWCTYFTHLPLITSGMNGIPCVTNFLEDDPLLSHFLSIPYTQFLITSLVLKHCCIQPVHYH